MFIFRSLNKSMEIKIVFYDVLRKVFFSLVNIR